MTGASVRLDSADLTRALAGLRRAGADLSGLMEEIAGHLEFATQRRFETESGPGGQPWTPSSRAREENGQTLTDTGRLRASITREVSAASSEWALAIGTNVVYAAIHQFGGTIQHPARTVTLYRHVKGRMDRFSDWRFVKRKNANYAEDHQVGPYSVAMPARPFLGIDGADETAIAEIAADWLGRAAGVAVAP